MELEHLEEIAHGQAITWLMTSRDPESQGRNPEFQICLKLNISQAAKDSRLVSMEHL